MLIPCWNGEATIERAIGSALELRSVPLEVVVVDDGSTDRTSEIVRRLAAADSRVRLEVLPQNVGASGARNRGLELVRGPWLTLLDADDRFTPGGLGRLVEAAVGSDAMAAIGQQYWTDGRSRWITRLYDNPDVRRPGRKGLGTHPGLLYFASPHAKLVHRSCWDGLTFDGPFLGDQPWVIRALLRAGGRVQVLGDDVYEWHRPAAHDERGSITTRSRSSARAGVEAAAMARQAYQAVAEGATGRLNGQERGRLLSTYIERLLRYDLVPHVNNALDRRDPDSAKVIDGVTSFISAMPPELLVASEAIGRDALVPPLLRWHKLDLAARDAYERLIEAAGRLDPGAAARVGDWRHRIALRVGLGLPRAIGGPLAQALLAGTLLPARIWRRLRTRTASQGLRP